MKKNSRAFLEKLKRLRGEVHRLLANHLTYPKTVLTLLQERRISEERLLRMQEVIDEVIHLVDFKFHELIQELEKKIEKSSAPRLNSKRNEN